jgi:tryptophanyl-tRNA synthetase
VPEERVEETAGEQVSAASIPAAVSDAAEPESATAASPRLPAEKRKRVVSGMRPTGPLHIGHFFGAISNWLKLQEKYDCFFFVADWHALTTHYADTSQVAQNTLEMTLDWLSTGVDPAKATVFIQSAVPEHAELHLLLSMITPLGWLERVPTYKEQIENLRDKDLGTYGFLGYPLLQTADIVIYDADLVPVGEDQVPHVELSREVVRRFNLRFGGLRLSQADYETWNTEDEFSLRAAIYVPGIPTTFKPSSSVQPPRWQDVADNIKVITAAIEEWGYENYIAKVPAEFRNRVLKRLPFRTILREPQPLLTETPRLPGTDGRRMAKSYGNAIWLKDSVEEIRAKAKNMMTDPARVRRTDPGNPDICPVFSYHKLFSDAATIAMVNHDCRTAEIGCVDCKGKMADGLIRWIEPVQTRRREFERNPRLVWDILDAGSKSARKTASATMKRVRKAVFHWEEARKKAGAAGPAIQSPATVSPSAARGEGE